MTHRMHVALLCTNLFNIDEHNKTGSGIFDHILIHSLAKLQPPGFDMTVFASGESSTLPARVVSVDEKPSSADQAMLAHGKHGMFELALLSKAFSMQETFDLYHVNIGDGDLAMPFAALVGKPIVITLHNIVNEPFTRKYFSLFQDCTNVFFISTSAYQRTMLPALQYVDTIYHGIDTDRYPLDPRGGRDIMWAGRLIPGKGPDTALRLAKKVKRTIKLFGVVKDGYQMWYERAVRRQVKTAEDRSLVSIHENLDRSKLIPHYRSSKLFVLPTVLEEAFGLVFVESMACGTPVIAYARGSGPEIIRDGETGFLVNPSDGDIRGDWIVKRTGFSGLCEAVDRVYAMAPQEYYRMRQACRKRAVEHFSAERMARLYFDVYARLTDKT